MKQILVITRIDTANPEFIRLFPGQSQPVKRDYDDYRLAVYDGALLHGAFDDMVENITGKVDKEASEILFVLHSDKFDALSEALLSKTAEGNWGVAQYSESDHHYFSDIKPTLQAVLSDNSAVERIYWLFTCNPVMEAKLNLLHSCLTPDRILPLDDLLIMHEDEYDKFIKRVAGTTWDSPSYIAALTELRKSLLGD